MHHNNLILTNLTTTFRKAPINAFRTPAGRPEKMKVKDLIKELQKQDPEKEVMIQQGDELTFADNYTPCNNDNPDDMCDHCNCWKSTRKNCS